MSTTCSNVVTFEDVNGQPVAQINELPELKLGDRVTLHCKLTRENLGRHEELIVHGDFRVTSLRIDASTYPRKRLLHVESVGKPPTWRSVKKDAHRRPLAPAKSPRTPI